MSSPDMKIVTYPDRILRAKAKEIKEIDGRVADLAADMAALMYAAPGIGLAAPQVGVSERLIVFDLAHTVDKMNLITLVNPTILEMQGSVIGEEGCLSVPDFKEDVLRSQRVVVRGYNLDGQERTIDADGLLAIVLQHEIDHLDGILFIDRLSSVKKGIIQRKIRKMIRDQSEDH